MKTMKGSELQPVVVVHVKEGMQVLPFRRGGFYLDVFGVEHLAVAMTSAAGGGGSCMQCHVHVAHDSHMLLSPLAIY